MDINRSKYLSYLLRHKPEEVGCTLDKYGWCDVATLIKNSDFTMDELSSIVAEDTRYEFSEDRSMIRAFHGHSVAGIVYQDEVKNVTLLYHGTTIDGLEKIIKSGAILPMSRVQVHLSKDIETAKKVASRHGKPIIIVVDAQDMVHEGLKVYKSKDGVYLTNVVPSRYFKEIINEP
jgi:putative RNA 2'-phosphotransferase